MNKVNNKNIVYTALSAGLLCVLAPIALPIGVVSITLTTLIIYLLFDIFNPKISFAAVIIYILMGCIGLPVFSSYNSGIGHLLSPSGGFILGYIPMALLLTAAYKIKNVILKLTVKFIATVVMYIVAVIWFMFVVSKKIDLEYIKSLIIFIPFDILKIILSHILSVKTKRNLNY